MIPVSLCAAVGTRRKFSNNKADIIYYANSADLPKVPLEGWIYITEWFRYLAKVHLLQIGGSHTEARMIIFGILANRKQSRSSELFFFEIVI